MSLFDWILVAVGLGPLAAMAVAAFMESDYPARRILAVVPYGFWIFILVLVALLVRMLAGGSVAILVFTVLYLGVALLLLLPGLAVFLIRTREPRRKFEATVARGEAERPAFNALLLPKRSGR